MTSAPLTAPSQQCNLQLDKIRTFTDWSGVEINYRKCFVTCNARSSLVFRLYRGTPLLPIALAGGPRR
jgi:hypothetical protein